MSLGLPAGLLAAPEQLVKVHERVRCCWPRFIRV